MPSRRRPFLRGFRWYAAFLVLLAIFAVLGFFSLMLLFAVPGLGLGGCSDSLCQAIARIYPVTADNAGYDPLSNWSDDPARLGMTWIVGIAVFLAPFFVLSRCFDCCRKCKGKGGVTWESSSSFYDSKIGYTSGSSGGSLTCRRCHGSGRHSERSQIGPRAKPLV